MALRMWASSTANALRISCASKTPAFALSRCFSSGTQLISFPLPIIIFCKLMGWFFYFFSINSRAILLSHYCQLKKITYLVWFVVVLDGLKYASSHEWVKHEGSVATVGITDHAQVLLISVSFIRLVSYVWTRGG